MIDPQAMTAEEWQALTAKVNERARVADLLLRWSETTHGNEFGHDHHCPVTDDYGAAWVGKVAADDGCTCGWSTFRLAYDAMQKGAIG